MSNANFTSELAPKVAAARAPASAVALPYTNLTELLFSRAQSEAPYLVFPQEDGTRREWSYRALWSQARAIAQWLDNDLGLVPGDRVATLTGNTPETVLLYFAAWISGLTVVPINVTEDDARIAYILEHAEVAVAFAPPEQAARVTVCPVITELRFAHGQEGLSRHSLAPETEALIVYTSGTTGPPKGVVLEHQNLLVDAQAIAAWHGLTEADRAMLVLPIHHVNGIVVTLVTPCFSGGSVVLNRKFSASRFWKTVTDEGGTWCSVVPTVLAFLCESHPKGARIPPAFRHFICGAGPLTTDLARRFHERFGARVVHGYGLSETTCYSCFLPPDLELADYARWMWGCGFPSIGVPLPGTAMAIHDDAGAALPPGQRGEIVVRGPIVMRAYFQRPEANASAFAHGWFRSGDEGFWQEGEDGLPYFFITGRLKELIIRGGVNYSPLEIDEVLNAIPGVKAALAVGFENNFYGEEIGAYVQCEPGVTLTEAEVLAACRASLPFAKAPKVAVFGETLPVTSTGKYQRAKLKERFLPWKDAEFRTP